MSSEIAGSNRSADKERAVGRCHSVNFVHNRELFEGHVNVETGIALSKRRTDFTPV